MRDAFLVTGASGILGPRLIERLGPERCVVLAREASMVPDGVEVVRGDLIEPQLGLSDDVYRDLTSRIQGVVHAGAVTSGFWPREAHLTVNVDGTRRVVELAEAAGVPIHHVSTFYVLGANGTVDSEPVDAYQESKRIAETVVKASSVDSAIYRLPIILGDAATGEIPRFNGQAIYFAAKVIVSGNAHLLPAAPAALMDFLPRDYVAECLVAGIEGGLRGVGWIAAGRRAVSFERFVDMCVDVGRGMGRDVVVPKLVSPDTVERLILPAFGDSVPRQLTQQLRAGSRVVRGLTSTGPLPSAIETQQAGIEFPSVPDLEAVLANALGYWSQRIRLPAMVPVGSPS